MDIFSTRFLHIAENIFDQLDDKSLSNCREVAKQWQKCIDRKASSWIRIVKIPKIPKNGDTYLHVAAKTGQAEIFNLILENEDIKESNDNGTVTPFQLACERGHFIIIKMYIEKFDPTKMNFNKKDINGLTGFLLACKNGHSKTVDMLILDSTKLKLNLNATDIYHKTAFHLACENDHFEIAELIIKKSKEFEIDLNVKDCSNHPYKSAFHHALLKNHTKIIEMY